MRYLKWTLIILINFCWIINYSYAQKILIQHIVSTQTVVLRYQTQTDTLRIPIVSDKYPELKKALSGKNIFDGDDLATVIKNYGSCGCGITGLDYDVTFDSKGVISVILYYNTMAAYPDSYQRWITLDIKTGQVYPITKEINARGLKWIFDSYKITLRKRIDADKKTNDDENVDEYNNLKETVDSLGRDELFGKYVFTPKGVMFSIEKILPHVIETFEPDRDWIVPYNKLKDYKTTGAVILN